ncbi:DNA polymerase III subunit delta' [Synechococcus sp. Cruz-9H2]|uniref:DNA polymerase III subunit delta' n=1 Tax=unclassified Synechococcus TaxID=2626047 RepID=UPI0020CDB32F|nr:MULTISPECIES: DNA polymerase III subunit delta' [unclassified Synechococcus]MCP9820527.1 DNA polymerase III subunit delta' [Synechococcus sp. Cruz-9H2]MCP9843320.1 DNA polymerase III subunit delta' [Synechococcus sp. Edmonson 11F2]MCP9855065.1 DNA polymerase III subunit delta' [Synechococcus sp. Cruz-9C9]MCP9862464.1 DNA polymerase III subunit delta' [Synechococcus sp. Cruz-7E5]MCP9871373.1 DNA polymerase III subunit delta' [Synechococcus sp. Cruz-7B9]
MADLFADLIGQPTAVALMRSSLEQQRLAAAYLLSGPEGVGRRLGGLRFLEGVLAGPAGAPAVRRRLSQGNHPDLLWLEPTYSHQGRLVPVSQAMAEGVSKRGLPQIRLEQIRSVGPFLARRAVAGPRPVVVIEAVELMAEGAANGLLKTLEEPGAGLLLLLSTAPERLLSTIRSRCQQIPFRPLDPVAMAEVLAQQTDATQASGATDAADTFGAPEATDPPELIELAAGAPGALLEHRRQWRGLPSGLAERLGGLPADPLEAMALARDLSEALDLDQQLWLLNWWQLCLWRREPRLPQQHRLERLRGQLRGFVQPRLAWEVALLELSGVIV